MHRRRVLQSTGLLLAGGLAGCSAFEDDATVPRESAANADTDTSWPRQGFDPENRRYNPGGVVPDFPNEAWSMRVPFELPEPVVQDDTAFVREGEHVLAVDVTDGTERWQARADTAPVVDGKAVAVGRAGDVVLYRGSDGSEYDRFTGEGSLSTPPAPFRRGSFGVSRGERLAVINDPTVEDWERRLFGAVLGISTRDSFFLATATRAGEVYVFNQLGRGTEHRSINAVLEDRPILQRDMIHVLARSYGALHAFGNNQNTEWTTTVNPRQAVAVVDDYVYVPRERSMVVLTIPEFEPVYSTPVAGSARSVVVSGETAIVPTNDGFVYGLDRFDGSEQFRIDVGDTVKTVVPGARRLFVHAIRDGTSTLVVYD